MALSLLSVNTHFKKTAPLVVFIILFTHLTIIFILQIRKNHHRVVFYGNYIGYVLLFHRIHVHEACYNVPHCLSIHCIFPHELLK